MFDTQFTYFKLAEIKVNVNLKYQSVKTPNFFRCCSTMFKQALQNNVIIIVCFDFKYCTTTIYA